LQSKFLKTGTNSRPAQRKPAEVIKRVADRQLPFSDHSHHLGDERSMPNAPLSSLSREALEKLARQRKVSGAANLTKAQLLKALQPSAKSRAVSPAAARKSPPKAALAGNKGKKTPSAKSPAITPSQPPSKPTRKGVSASTASRANASARKTPARPATKSPSQPTLSRPASDASRKEISLGNPSSTHGQNSLVATPCDAHWIRVTWHLSRDSVARAQSRLGTEWHRATPVLRISRITTSDQAAGSETFSKDVVIDAHGNTHYLSVPQPGRAFRVQIGYLGKLGTFFAMAKSNVCHMPKPGPAQVAGEQLKSNAPEGGELLTDPAAGDDDSPVRPLGFSTLTHFGPSASQKRLTGEFQFKLATELVVHGSTRPGSQVTVQGEHVELRDDGSFTFRIPQPEGRQVLAFTAMDPRGNERRMIVMAMERNTKELERQYFDGGHVEGAED